MKAEDELKPGFLRDTFEGENATPPTGGFERLTADLAAQRRRRRPFTWIWIPALLLTAGGAWYAMRGGEQAPASLAVGQPAASGQAQAETQSPPTKAGIRARAATGSQVAQSPAMKGQNAQTIGSANESGARASEEKAGQPSHTIAEASVTAPEAERNFAVSATLSDAADQPTASTEPEPRREGKPVRSRRSTKAVSAPVVLAAAGNRYRLPVAVRTGNGSSHRSQEPGHTLRNAQDNLAQADDQLRKTLGTDRSDESVQHSTESPESSVENAVSSNASPVAAAPATDSSAKLQLSVAKVDSAAKPATVTPVQKDKAKLTHRWEKGVYAGLMIRRRDAVLIQSEEGEMMNWSASQRYQIPGLELGGALNYRIIRNVSFGVSLGLGMWKESLDITSQSQQSQPTVAFNRATETFDVNPVYNEVKAGSLSWMVWQAHSSAYLRIGDPIMPFSAQAGPTLDAVHAFAGKSTGPSHLAPALLPTPATHFVPGVEAKFRFKPNPANPRGWAYEISGRNHFKPAFNNAGLFKLQYGMVTIGASFVW